MLGLPTFKSVDDVIHTWRSRVLSDAQKAVLVAVLTKTFKRSNKKIAELLSISGQTVTYLRSVSRLTEDELIYFHENEERISISHVRIISRFKASTRMRLLEKIAGPFSIGSRTLEQLVAGHKSTASFDDIVSVQNTTSEFSTFEEEVGDQLGRTVSISYDPKTRSGNLTLSFYTLDQLDKDLASLGYIREEDDF